MSLTKNDLQMIRHVVREEIEEVVDDKISHLPTKEEFFNSQDKLMTELKAIRQEQTTLSHRVTKLETQFV